MDPTLSQLIMWALQGLILLVGGRALAKQDKMADSLIELREHLPERFAGKPDFESLRTKVNGLDYVRLEDCKSMHRDHDEQERVRLAHEQDERHRARDALQASLMRIELRLQRQRPDLDMTNPLG